MVRQEFERRFAKASQIALEELHRLGLRSYPCYCDTSSCVGWQMLIRWSVEIRVELGLMSLEDAATGIVREIDEVSLRH